MPTDALAHVSPSPCYLRGYDAGCGLGDVNGCPFPLGGIAASEWEEGYLDAQADIAEACNTQSKDYR